MSVRHAYVLSTVVVVTVSYWQGRVDVALVRSRLVSTGSKLLVIGGRSGVGKSSVAFALHDQLAVERVRHAVIEGDALDLAWPAPWEHRLAERNLAAVWMAQPPGMPTGVCGDRPFDDASWILPSSLLRAPQCR